MVRQLKLLWIQDMVCMLMLNKGDSLFHGMRVDYRSTQVIRYSYFGKGKCLEYSLCRVLKYSYSYSYN